MRVSPAFNSAQEPQPLLHSAGGSDYRVTTVVECPTCWEIVDERHVCRCECGTPLDEHPPLPRPGRFVTWRTKATDPRMATNGSRWNRSRVDKRQVPAEHT